MYVLLLYVSKACPCLHFALAAKVVLVKLAILSYHVAACWVGWVVVTYDLLIADGVLFVLTFLCRYAAL
jgi:hypothetical protein